MSFYPIKTNDNTISLYNFNVKDVYHSKVGAYTEALYKYVVPSELIDFAKNNKKVKILDVCYGLGYNSRAAVNELLKIKPEIEIHVSALEIDPEVLAFSSILGSECFANDVNTSFFESLNSSINVEIIIKDYIEKLVKIMPQIKELIPEEYEIVQQDDLISKLHNIYYRSHSNRNIKVDFHIQDARFAIQSLSGEYDFIFHDPFTPSKAPILWTVEFFRALNKLLNENGNLTTYSNAAPVRSGMTEAGFYIGRTAPVGKKTSGTIAYKRPDLLKEPLTLKESGLITTKAGIPYRDRDFNNTIEEILINRKHEQDTSDKISSSKYLKSYTESHK